MESEDRNSHQDTAGMVKNIGKEVEIMKCLACGREMVNRETHLVCSNLLCDYAEELENREAGEPEICVEYLNPIIAWAIKH